MATCMAFLSASLYTATVWIPSFLAVLITLQAISPRFAIRIFESGVTFGDVLLAVGDKSGPEFE